MICDPKCRLNKKEMAQELGVCTATLRNWEREEEFVRALEQIKPTTQTENEWTTLKSVLYKKALGGDVPAAKLLLQMKDMNLTTDTARGITLEEALELIVEYHKLDTTSSTKIGSAN